MVSFDTNLAVYAAHSGMADHASARAFIAGLAGRDDVVVSELMLVELYLKLRNPKIFARPMSPASAVQGCQIYRENRLWTLVESAPVMDEVWRRASKQSFAFRRIVDLRLGLTLLHYGVDEFATANTKDFRGVGFSRVWNPLKGSV